MDIDLEVHEAGPLVKWVQRCTRCGYVISDYRNAAWPVDQPPPSGFKTGTFVEVDNPLHGPKYTGVVNGPATCVAN